MLNLAQSRAIRVSLSIAFAFVTVLFLFLEIFEVSGEDSSFRVIIAVDLIYSMLLPEISETREKKKKIFYLQKLRCKKMDTGIFDLLRGKRVKIRTIDEYVDGEVVNVDEEYIVIKKEKKNSTETVYVNKGVIQTVKFIKQK